MIIIIKTLTNGDRRITVTVVGNGPDDSMAQSAGSAENTDCISVERQDSPSDTK